MEAGFLGVESTGCSERHGLLFTVEQMGTMTVDTVKALASLPVKVWGVAKAVVGVEERAAGQPGQRRRRRPDRRRGHLATRRARSWSGSSSWSSLLAGLNLFVGMFNFIPLLPLDGGHIAGALYEGPAAASHGSSDGPTRASSTSAKLLPVAYVMAGVLLVMSMVLIVGDIVAPVSLG